MSLLELQRAFHASLVDASEPPLSTMGAALDPGVAVHRNNYRSQLISCLRETFEKTRAWLGEEAFTAAAISHSIATPPSAWTLGAYGDGFDRTLDALYPRDPEVAELAWLDWALSRAFEGTDATPMASDALALVDWDNASLILTPTLRIARVSTNAAAIWSALAGGTMPPAADLLLEPIHLIVWRQEFTPNFRSIDSTEHDALVQMQHGATFGELCATLVEVCADDAGIATASALLGQWLRDAVVVGAE
ncbi:MAG: DNA-binding domain-containing protein [Casimicrobiaceae bacterium]